MNDRTALLTAIHANPDDDLHRLVFADWLEENRSSDFDDALAESIRLACTGKARKKSAVRWTKWLHDNWRRLVPTLLARHHATDKFPEAPFTRRVGSEVVGSIIWKNPDFIPGQSRGLRETTMGQFVLLFHSGLLAKCVIYHPCGLAVLADAVRADHPHCELLGDRPERECEKPGYRERRRAALGLSPNCVACDRPVSHDAPLTATLCVRCWMYERARETHQRINAELVAHGRPPLPFDL